jgi:hypothetical protein
MVAFVVKATTFTLTNNPLDTFGIGGSPLEEVNLRSEGKFLAIGTQFVFGRKLVTSQVKFAGGDRFRMTFATLPAPIVGTLDRLGDSLGFV